MTFKAKINWEDEIDNLRLYGKQGKTMHQISIIYGCSRQRIKQVIDRRLPEWHEIYGKAVRDLESQRKLENLQTWRQRKWGSLNKLDQDDLYWTQRQRFAAKRNNAKRSGYIWNLEFGDLIWPEVCPILGIQIDYYATSRLEASPSFDQIVPGHGYVRGNVQVISWRANRIKNDGTWEEHQKIADYMKKLLVI